MAQGFKPPSPDTYQGQYTPPDPKTLQDEQPGVLERTWNAAGGQGIADVVRSINDPAARERTGKRVEGIVQGIKNEPGRIMGEVKQIGSNLSQGNISNAVEHLGSAVPFLGPGAKQILSDIETDQYPEMVGHTAQTFGPFALKYLPKATEVAGEGGNIARDAAVGGFKGGMERVPMGKMYGIDFGETQVPASLKWGAAFGLPGEGLGLARGNATSGLPAAALGASIPVIRGAYRGVKAGRALRAGAEAAAEPAASLDELAQGLTGKNYRNLTAEEQAQIQNIQTKTRQRNITQERPQTQGPSLPPADPNAPRLGPYEMMKQYLEEQRQARRGKPNVERNPAWKSLVPESEAPATPEPTSETIIPSQLFRRARPRPESPGAFDALVKAARKKKVK